MLPTANGWRRSIKMVKGDDRNGHAGTVATGAGSSIPSPPRIRWAFCRKGGAGSAKRTFPTRFERSVRRTLQTMLHDRRSRLGQSAALKRCSPRPIFRCGAWSILGRDRPRFCRWLAPSNLVRDAMRCDAWSKGSGCNPCSLELEVDERAVSGGPREEERESRKGIYTRPHRIWNRPESRRKGGARAT